MQPKHDGASAASEARCSGVGSALRVSQNGRYLDYERLPETVAGLHFAVFALLMLVKAVAAACLPQSA